jgi:hypothetical protein
MKRAIASTTKIMPTTSNRIADSSIGCRAALLALLFLAAVPVFLDAADLLAVDLLDLRFVLDFELPDWPDFFALTHPPAVFTATFGVLMILYPKAG